MISGSEESLDEPSSGVLSVSIIETGCGAKLLDEDGSLEVDDDESMAAVVSVMELVDEGGSALVDVDEEESSPLVSVAPVELASVEDPLPDSAVELLLLVVVVVVAGVVVEEGSSVVDELALVDSVSLLVVVVEGDEVVESSGAVVVVVVVVVVVFRLGFLVVLELGFL